MEDTNIWKVKNLLVLLNPSQLAEAKYFFDSISNGETKKIQDVINDASYKLYQIESLLHGVNELLHKSGENQESSMEITGYASVIAEITESRVKTLMNTLDHNI